jgi:hypothetical protein
VALTAVACQIASVDIVMNPLYYDPMVPRRLNQ